ncbi:hypothetical protein KCU65_g5581, partial [Aureobasidium melanogenum]
MDSRRKYIANMTPILLHVYLAWIIPSTLAEFTLNNGTSASAILPSPTITYSLQAPSTTGSNYTRSHTITQTVVGTKHVIINTASKITSTSTEWQRVPQNKFAEHLVEVSFLYDTTTSFVGAAHVVNTEKTTPSVVASTSNGGSALVVKTSNLAQPNTLLSSAVEIGINSPQNPVVTSASLLSASKIQQTTPLLVGLSSTEQIASRTNMPTSIDVGSSSQEASVATPTSEASAVRDISSNNLSKILSSQNTIAGVKFSDTISTETEVVPAPITRVAVVPLTSVASADADEVGTIQVTTLIPVASVANNDGQNTSEASANVNTEVSAAVSSRTTLISTTRETTLLIQSTLTISPLLPNSGQASSSEHAVNSLLSTTSDAVVQGSLGSSLSSAAVSSSTKFTSSDDVSSTGGTSKYHAVVPETITVDSPEGTSTVIIAGSSTSNTDATSKLMTSSLLGQGLPAVSSELPSASSNVISTSAVSVQIATTASAQSTEISSSAPSINNTAAVTPTSRIGNTTTVLPTSVPTSAIGASNDVGHLQAMRFEALTLVVMIFFFLL